MLSDVSGAPLTPAVLSKALRGAAACELVPGTELKQPGSHTALLRDVANPTSTVFLKKVTAAFVGNKGWIDRRRVLLYIRNELRFYDEFGDALRARGVALPHGCTTSRLRISTALRSRSTSRLPSCSRTAAL